MKHTRTSLRSPRANSTFKTTETRETYRMAEEIMSILNNHGPMTIMNTKNLINEAHDLGYCRPLIDSERIASAHPYWKVLSDMTDPASPLFVNNLEEIGYYDVLCYRLRTDVYRTSRGTWKKVKGARLLDSMPE